MLKTSRMRAERHFPGRIVAFGVALAMLCFPASVFAEDAAPGKIVSVRPMSLNATLSAVATAVRTTYISRGANGQPIIVSGAVLTPKPRYLIAHPTNANKIVAWGHGTAGMADQCAPSRQSNLYPDPAYNDYADVVAGYLTQGWTVSASDYPGLGGPGTHPYLVGDSEGRAVIDSVRAARNLNRSLSSKWVAVGHSQGGQAVLFASQLANTYGAGLRLKGTIAVAPASNLDLLGQAIPGTPGQGFLAMAIYGLAAVDPTVDPTQILAQPALDLAGVLHTGCFNEVMSAYAPLTADAMVVGGALSQTILDKLAQSNPARQPNSSPVLLVQGDADQTIPLEITQLLQYEECSVNTQPVQLNVYPGQDHDPVLSASQTDVVDYITARFGNLPAPSNCN